MIIQSDFDGTISEEDVSFTLLDTFAQGDWRKLFQQYRDNKISVGDFNTKAFAMVKVGREEMLQVAREKVRLRQGLHNLVDYCEERGFRFIIVSNGLDFYIKSILENIGLGNIEVHAARTRFHSEGLEVEYIGPDGNTLKKGFKEAYTKVFLTQGYRVIYVGNGPSDIAPASLAQHIFARDGLLDGCREKKLSCQPFEDFDDIVSGLKSLP